MSNSARSPKPAFAEATGGAIGALLATLIFYPFDVAKTRLQAEADATEEEEEENGKAKKEAEDIPKAPPSPLTREPSHHETTYWGELRVFMKQPELWYAGLGPKLQLALVSSFLYFYCYATFKRIYSHGLKQQLKFLPNLILASLAGIVNVLVTMPLDVVVTRLQVAHAGHPGKFLELVRHIYKQDPKKFWQGLVPALILTLNPAINYAAFDAMKSIVGRARKRRPDTREILVLGLVSKFLATVITYPLIRAKVIMMANVPMVVYHKHDDKPQEGEEAAVVPVPPAASEVPDMHLLQVLSRTVKEEGLMGLYVGCDAQVINTALKNSMLLSTKEQISRFVTFIFGLR